MIPKEIFYRQFVVDIIALHVVQIVKKDSSIAGVFAKSLARCTAALASDDESDDDSFVSDDDWDSDSDGGGGMAKYSSCEWSVEIVKDEEEEDGEELYEGLLVSSSSSESDDNLGLSVSFHFLCMLFFALIWICSIFTRCSTYTLPETVVNVYHRILIPDTKLTFRLIFPLYVYLL